MFSGDAAIDAMFKKGNSFMFDDVIVPEEVVSELHPLPDDVLDEFQGILNRNQASQILQPRSDEEVIVPVEAVAELPVKKKAEEEVIVPIEAVAELPVKKKDLSEEVKKPKKKKVEEEAEFKKKKHGSKEKEPASKEVQETKKKKETEKKKEEDPPAKKLRPFMNVVKDQFPVFIPTAHPFVLISICQRCLCEANNKIKMSSCGKEYITFVMCHDCVQKNNTLRAIFK